MAFLYFNKNIKTKRENTIILPSSSSSYNSQLNITPSLMPKNDNNIKDILDSMNIDEKIGQMVICGYNDLDEITPLINEKKLGGVILFSKNIRSVAQTKNEILKLKESNEKNKVPLFISVDQEGGRVVRLPEEMGKFESAQSIGAKNDDNYSFNAGNKIGKALKQLGFNLDFAPVLDIYSNPQNTVISDRSFGTTPEKVSKIGIQVLKGIQSENVIPTIKHFPGHGDTEVDSHYGLPLFNKSLEELNNFEFKPFIDAINNGADMIMIAHIKLTKIDDLPSTMSYDVVTNVLRKKLNFNGVVITDDLEMKAITKNYNLSDATINSVKAGCDIILVSQGAKNSEIVIKALKIALVNGQITEKRIDESVYRILSLKYKYGLKDI